MSCSRSASNPWASAQYGCGDVSMAQYGCGCGAAKYGEEYDGGSVVPEQEQYGSGRSAKRTRSRSRTPSRRTSKPVERFGDEVFLKPKSMTSGHRKYCRCLLKVAAKQTKPCLRRQASGSKKRTSGCANPYAVCARIPHGKKRACVPHFNFKKIPRAVAESYAALKNKTMEELVREASAEIRALKRKH